MGKLLGVTGHYIGMLERGEKNVEAHSAIAKLFTLLEANKIDLAEVEPSARINHDDGLVLNKPSAVHSTPPTHRLSVSDVVAQIHTDLQLVETGDAQEQRRAFMMLREVHLPCLAQLLKLS